MHTVLTSNIFTLCICLLSTATILSSSSSSSNSSAASAPATTLSKRSRTTDTSSAKRQRITVYTPSSCAPSEQAPAMGAQTTLLPATLTEVQPSLDADGFINIFGDGFINIFGDAITSIRIAAAKIVMQPQGLQIECGMSGQKYLDAFARLPLTESLNSSLDQHRVYVHWHTLIQTIANSPDLPLACKCADNFIAKLAQHRVNSSFDFAARTLLAKAHRIAIEGLHALEQKDNAQAKTHLHHATTLYYKLRSMNLTAKVHDSCVIPDVTADFKRLETCLRTLGTLKVELPPVAP